MRSLTYEIAVVYDAIKESHEETEGYEIATIRMYDFDLAHSIKALFRVFRLL